MRLYERELGRKHRDESGTYQPRDLLRVRHLDLANGGSQTIRRLTSLPLICAQGAQPNTNLRWTVPRTLASRMWSSRYVFRPPVWRYAASLAWPAATCRSADQQFGAQDSIS